MDSRMKGNVLMSLKSYTYHHDVEKVELSPIEEVPSYGRDGVYYRRTLTIYYTGGSKAIHKLLGDVDGSLEFIPAAE